MTRTTELLKGCGHKDEWDIICGEKYAGGLELCPSCKSQLRGRLDALKEEEEFLEICSKNLNTIDYEENDRTALAVCRDINYRLASIQEEIKLIESAGVGK